MGSRVGEPVLHAGWGPRRVDSRSRTALGLLVRSWRDAGPYPCGRGGRALCSVKIGESSAGICKKLPGGDSNCSSRSRIAGQWDFKALLGPAPTRGYHSERRHTGISQSVDAGWGKGRQIFPLRPLFYGLLAGLRRGLLFFPSITVRLCVGGRDCVRRASWRDKDDPGRSFSNRCALGWNFDAHDYNDPLLFHFPSARANRLILTFVGSKSIFRSAVSLAAGKWRREEDTHPLLSLQQFRRQSLHHGGHPSESVEPVQLMVTHAQPACTIPSVNWTSLRMHRSRNVISNGREDPQALFKVLHARLDHVF